MRDNLTVREAAELYGCTHSNMNYMINTRRIPAFRFGKHWVVSREDVLALKLSRDTREATNTRIQPIELEAA